MEENRVPKQEPKRAELNAPLYGYRCPFCYRVYHSGSSRADLNIECVCGAAMAPFKFTSLCQPDETALDAPAYWYLCPSCKQWIGGQEITDTLVCPWCKLDTSTDNPVDHPDHYNWFGIECIDVIERFNYNLGAAIKHIWRAGRKNDIIEDLEKAAWYVRREIERLSSDE